MSKEEHQLSGYLMPWNINQVAKYLGVSKRTVYRMIEEDTIPYKRAGGRLFFNPMKIAEFAGMIDPR